MIALKIHCALAIWSKRANREGECVDISYPYHTDNCLVEKLPRVLTVLDVVAIEPFQRLRCWRRRQFLLLSPLVQCFIGLVGPWQDQIHAIHYDRIRYTCLFDDQSSLWRYDHDTGTGAERKLNATYVRAIQLCSSLIAAVIILISIMISTRRIDVSHLRTRIMLRFEWAWERDACVVAFWAVQNIRNV